MFGPLTGPASLYGHILLGAEALMKDVNAHGGINGRKIEIIAEDDACDPIKGVAAVKKLLYQDKVFMIDGGVCSGVSLAVKPEIIKAGVPWMVVGAAATEIATPAQPTIFQASTTASDNVNVMVDFAMSKPGITKIAIISHSDDWGKSYREPALQRLESKYHIQPIAELRMERGSMDATPQVLQLRNSGAQVVLAMLYPAELAIFMRDGFKYGMQIPVFGNSGVSLEDTLKRVGNPAALKNLYVYYHLAGPVDGPELAEPRGIFQKYYPNETIDTYTFVGMAGTRVIFHVLQGLGPDVTRAGFLAALDKLQNFDSGVEAGPINFSPADHDGAKEGVMRRFEGDKIIALKRWSDEKGN
jgi:branched-chain amino acid transport system substrate-binding protein